MTACRSVGSRGVRRSVTTGGPRCGPVRPDPAPSSVSWCFTPETWSTGVRRPGDCPRCRCACTTTRSRWTRRSSAGSSPSQMPDLADRPLTMVEPWGTDNAIWRLGDDLVVRLPRIALGDGTGRPGGDVAAPPGSAPPRRRARARRRRRARRRLPLPVGGAPVDTRRAAPRSTGSTIPSRSRSTSPTSSASCRACRPTAPPRPATGPGRCGTTTRRRAGPSTVRAT